MIWIIFAMVLAVLKLMGLITTAWLWIVLVGLMPLIIFLAAFVVGLVAAATAVVGVAIRAAFRR